jgi:tetratricopeptide (TPR) repeat protein
MQFRFTRMIVLIVGVSLAATACGRYSIGSIRSSKAFKDGLEEYQKADYRSAVESFERSTQLSPDFQLAGFAYFYEGNAYDKLYRPARKGEPDNDANLEKAVENYRKAIEKLASSDLPQAGQFRNLSFQYLVAAYGPDRLNDFSKAEAVAKELIAAEPNEPTNYQALGRLYQDQGRNDEAEQMFIKATEVQPNNAVGYQLLANFYNQTGDFDKTLAAFQKRAEVEPNNPEAWHTMGTFYYDKVLRDTRLSPSVAKGYLQAGNQAEDKALALNDQYLEAVQYKNMLLTLQANKEPNIETKKQLLQEATKYYQKAMQMRATQSANPAPKK